MGKVKRKRNLFEEHWLKIRAELQSMSKREIQKEIDAHMDREFKDEEARALALPNLHLNDPSHPLPKTRRQFLAQGLTAATGMVFAPGIFQALSTSAFAADCSANAAVANPMIPFMAIDGAGGFSMAGTNFIVGANNNPMNFLPGDTDYQLMGLPTAQHPKNRTPIAPFGYPMHPESRIAQGIIETASQAALDRTSGFLVAVSSGDDTGNNPWNINQALAQAGLTGNLTATIGTTGNASGGNSTTLIAVPAFRAARATSVNQATQLVSVGQVSQVLNLNQTKRIVASVSELANDQMTKINDAVVAAKVKDVVVCGSQKNVEVLGAAAVDVAGDANLTQLFPNFNQGFDSGSNLDPALAVGLKLISTGQAGSSTVEVGGCDYHGNGSPNQQAKDRLIGRAIGRVIEYAHRIQQPIILNLFTDGSVDFSSRQVGQNSVLYEPSGDNGSMGALVMIVYNPGGRVPVTRPQLGSYGRNGVLSGATPWANSPNVAARVIAANYLYLTGKLSAFQSLFPTPGFNVNDVIAFGASIRPQS